MNEIEVRKILQYLLTHFVESKELLNLGIVDSAYLKNVVINSIAEDGYEKNFLIYLDGLGQSYLEVKPKRITKIRFDVIVDSPTTYDEFVQALETAYRLTEENDFQIYFATSDDREWYFDVKVLVSVNSKR